MMDFCIFITHCAAPFLEETLDSVSDANSLSVNLLAASFITDFTLLLSR
jgi:hypothetical protein